MAVNEKVQAAWRRCPFCKQLDENIMAVLHNPKRWVELPLGHACGWSRLCQVAARNRLQMEDPGLWRALCQKRSEVNNEPSYRWDEPAEWTEDFCEAYMAVNRPEIWKHLADQRKRAREEESWKGGWKADGLRVTSVTPGTPAYTADLRVKDLLLEVNGVPVTAWPDVEKMRDNTEHGDPLDLVVLRGEERISMQINRPSRRRHRSS